MALSGAQRRARKAARKLLSDSRVRSQLAGGRVGKHKVPLLAWGKTWKDTRINKQATGIGGVLFADLPQSRAAILSRDGVCRKVDKADYLDSVKRAEVLATCASPYRAKSVNADGTVERVSGQRVWNRTYRAPMREMHPPPEDMPDYIVPAERPNVPYPSSVERHNRPLALMRELAERAKRKKRR